MAFLTRTVQPAVRILGVDPGGATLGVAILDVYPTSGEIEVVTAYTVDSTKQVDETDHLYQRRGGRYARHRVQAKRFERVLRMYCPDVVAIESSFSFVRPEAFAALTELMLRLVDVVDDYDPGLPIERIAPMQAKKACGVTNYKSKPAVTEALKKLNLKTSRGFLESLDEHSTDAIAVGVTVAKTIISGEYAYAS